MRQHYLFAQTMVNVWNEFLSTEDAEKYNEDAQYEHDMRIHTLYDAIRALFLGYVLSDRGEYWIMRHCEEIALIMAKYNL
jgi:hypothetical protein